MGVSTYRKRLRTTTSSISRSPSFLEGVAMVNETNAAAHTAYTAEHIAPATLYAMYTSPRGTAAPKERV